MATPGTAKLEGVYKQATSPRIDPAYPDSERPTFSVLPSYSDSTRFVTASAPGGGDGSLSAPWTLDEAMSNAVAGDIVGVAAGVYVGTPTASRFTPSFYPANSGTSVDPIIFVAENQASKVTAGYSDIRSGSTTHSGGNPAFGSLSRDHIYWIGFYSNEADSNNKTCADSGLSSCWTSVGGRIQGCKLRGVQPDFTDNHSGLRIENVDLGLFSDNDIAGFNASSGGGSTNQTGMTTYSMRNSVIEYNLIDNCGHNLYIKGNTGTDQFNNKVRFNLFINAVGDGMRLGAIVAGPGGERTDVYQNLLIDNANDIQLAFSATVAAANNGLDIYNNSIYTNTGSGSSYSLYITDSVETHDNTFRNNAMYVQTRNSYYNQFSSGNSAANFAAYIDSSYNCFFGATNFSSGSGGSTLNQSTLAGYQTASGSEASSIAQDPLFTNPAGGDFTLQAGSPALNLGEDYKQLLGGSTTASINLGCHVNASQDEVIGVR